MQRGRGSRNDFFDFGDPFAGFGGFEGHRSIMSSFLGGRDPFDDPFFQRPFGSMGSSMFGPGMLGSGMLGPGMLGSGMLGPGMLGPSVFGHGMSGNRGSFIGDSASSGFIENRICEPNKSKGIVIEELNSDEEEEEDKAKKEKETNSRKHHRPSKEPFVEEPDDEMKERKNKHTQLRNEYYRADRAQPQTHSVSFQSSTVTYGGVNGAYYTSSKTRRTGGDGVTVEESKEADTTTGRAAHRVARGIHDKGHSLTRKLNSDGRVDTLQTLHNLNEDELDGFEDTWKVNARKHLPGWEQQLSMNGPTDVGAGSSNRQSGQPSRGWALPSTERAAANGDARVNSFEGRAQANKRANGEMKPKSFNA